MRIRQLFVAGFFALVLGAAAGLLKDDVHSALMSDATDGLRTDQFVDESADYPAPRDTVFENAEINCLTEIMFREGRNQSVGVRSLIGMVAIARRDDPDPQWPRTICGVMRQKGQISGINTVLDISIAQLRVLEQTQQIAAEIYESAWKKQLLPHGWECVRYWKLSDTKLATLDAKHFAQLGITKSMKGLAFFDKLEAVPGPPGDVTFYRDPNRCMKPLPTT